MIDIPKEILCDYEDDVDDAGLLREPTKGIRLGYIIVLINKHEGPVAGTPRKKKCAHGTQGVDFTAIGQQVTKVAISNGLCTEDEKAAYDKRIQTRLRRKLVHLYNFKMKDNKQAITDTCQEAISEPGRAYTAPADVLCVTEVPRDSEVSCSSSTSRTQEICTNDKCFLDLFLANRRIARNNTLKTECRNMRTEIDNLNKILDRRNAAEARLKRQRKYKKNHKLRNHNSEI